MEVVHERVAGLDIGKATLTVHPLAGPTRPGKRVEAWTFATAQTWS